MIISIIVAMNEAGVIGKGGGLPWHLPADLTWFKSQTLGKPVLMGRKTFHSIEGPLPGRRNIVLSRQEGFVPNGCTVAKSVDDALKEAGGAEELMVMGGAECYRAFLPLAKRLYLTVVHGEIEGDTAFPDYDRSEWREKFRQDRPADEANRFALTFLILERKGAEA